MRTKVKLLIIILLCAPIYLSAQKPDTAWIESSLTIKHGDRVEWLERYDRDIQRYKAENAVLKDKSCDVLFLGSSSINMWNDIYTDMAPMKVIRRSYGGSSIRDNIYNYETIAQGYSPRRIVLYVENDINEAPEAISAGLCYDLFRVFVERLIGEYPNTPIYIISLKPSPSRANYLEQQAMVNELLKDYAGRTPYVEFIDVAAAMHDQEGKLREDIFVGDRLHMNRKGYDIWRDAIKPLLMEGLYQ